MYEALQKFSKENTLIKSSKKLLKAASNPFNKKRNEVENRYARWKQKIDQLAKNKDESGTSPRLPKI